MPEERLDRLDRLESDHRDLARTVGGLSRHVERLEATDIATEARCTIHKEEIVEIKSSQKKMSEKLSEIERKVDNKWPSLLASFFGASLPAIGVTIALVRYLKPLIERVGE